MQRRTNKLYLQLILLFLDLCRNPLWRNRPASPKNLVQMWDLPEFQSLKNHLKEQFLYHKRLQIVFHFHRAHRDMCVTMTPYCGRRSPFSNDFKQSQ